MRTALSLYRRTMPFPAVVHPGLALPKLELLPQDPELWDQETLKKVML